MSRVTKNAPAIRRSLSVSHTRTHTHTHTTPQKTHRIMNHRRRPIEMQVQRRHQLVLFQRPEHAPRCVDPRLLSCIIIRVWRLHFVRWTACTRFPDTYAYALPTNKQPPPYLTVRRIGVDRQRQRRKCRHCVGIGRRLSQRLCFVFICICMCLCVCAYTYTYISHTHTYIYTHITYNHIVTHHHRRCGRVLEEEDVDHPRQLVLPVRAHRYVAHAVAVHCMYGVRVLGCVC